jgi:rare lipoprotein A
MVIGLNTNEAAASQCGKASWYSAGSRTANGERMNSNALAAAHRSLPFGTHVRVENLKNGQSVVVRINDRGPFVRGRVIDVTRGAAVALGMIHSGTASVRVTVVDGSKSLNGCSSELASR